MSGCGCRSQSADQQRFEAGSAATGPDDVFGLAGLAPGQTGAELFEALTEAGADASAGPEADELAEAALEDELAAQQELDELLAESDADAPEAVEPGLDELLALLRNRPGLKITLSY